MTVSSAVKICNGWVGANKSIAEEKNIFTTQVVDVLNTSEDLLNYEMRPGSGILRY